MSDKHDERFVEFLLQAAADYNRPPETPREEMWSRIEESVFEPTLSRMAADYNQPPETPRDEMWSRIEAAWQFRASAPETIREAGFEPLAPLDVGDVAEVGKARRTPRITPWAWGLAVAASLTIGVVIGRQSMGELGTGPTVAGATQQPVRPEGVDAIGAEAAADDAAGGDLAGGDLTGANLALADAVPATRGTETAALQPEAASDQRNRGAVTHKTATVQHLTRTEAFLTTLRTDAEPNDQDGQVSRWARSLLADTRLLLDWPVERDPRMTVLLQELELLLAQIAQLGGAVPDGERSLIIEDLETNNVLPRLRSAIPAGRVAGTQSGV
jgi:hypothetical protein